MRWQINHLGGFLILSVKPGCAQLLVTIATSLCEWEAKCIGKFSAMFSGLFFFILQAQH